MGPLASLSSTFQAALTAITSRISTYFQASDRFRSEFVIPAVAFVLGCLAVVMDIVGPGAPRAWWEGLGTDLKLLVLALLTVLLVIVEETSRSLIALVRQLYSGDAPGWGWWQQVRRQPFLERQLTFSTELEQLGEAGGVLQEARDQLERYVTPAPKVLSAVLIRPARPYYLIGHDDCARREMARVEGALTDLADLVGRYAVTPLEAGKPIFPAQLRPVPNACYLAADRRTVSVQFGAHELTPDITPGLVVTLHLAGLRPRSFADLFVLDRQADVLLLSAPTDQIDTLLEALPGSRRTITYGPQPLPARAIPVLKVGPIHPGQALDSSHICWRLATQAEMDVLASYALSDMEVLGRLYGPPASSGTPGPSLNQDAPFPKTALQPPPTTPPAQGAPISGAILDRLNSISSDLDLLLASSGSELLKASTDQNPDEEAISRRAERMKTLADALVDLRTLLDQERQKSPPPDDASYNAANDEWTDKWTKLREAVGEWTSVVEALHRNRQRGYWTALPHLEDKLAEVRATEMGNILAAAYEHPTYAYGIDTAIVLPRLLGVLTPEDAEAKRLQSTESSLNMLLLFSFWAYIWAILGGLALVIFGGTPPFAGVVILGGVLLGLIAQTAAKAQAHAYGSALKNLFDLRRHVLFEALGYPITWPLTPKDESKHWQNLGQLFTYGDVERVPALTPKKGAETK